MSWIAVLFIGLAIGWALEFILDFIFWGRRNRDLAAHLTRCQANFQASEEKVEKIQTVVSQYKAKEDQYHQCQYDLASLEDQNHNLEILTERTSTQLKKSEQFAHQLNSQLSEMKVECGQVNDSLEEVGHWVESSMRRRIWEPDALQQKLNRSKEQTVAYTRKITATATSHIGHAAERIGGIGPNIKNRVGRAFSSSRPKRWLNGSYCYIWTLIGMVHKRASMPQSCPVNRK